MKKCLFILLLTFFQVSLLPVFAQQKKLLNTIIIDPGHGGLDPGAKGTFSTEAAVSLAVSLKLGQAIRDSFPDINLIFTRTTDVLPGNKPNKNEALRYRANLANSSGGNLFIAIHCNSAGKRPGGWYDKRVVGHVTKYRMVKKGKKMVKKKYSEPVYENYWVENLVKGTETYIWAMSKNDAKVSSMTENANFYGEIDSTMSMKMPDPSDPEDAARMLVYTQNFFRKSLTMADLVEKEFISQGRNSRGVKQRNDKGIWVLQATGMPSVLVEIGFISNKEEEEYINSEKGQDEIVHNILRALSVYKQRLEARQQATEKKAF